VSLRGLLSDIYAFLLRTPATPTFVEFASGEEREEYSRRILQRLGLDVSEYSVLNIHSIGIDVPVRYVFEEILTWDGDSRCWPNLLARVSRVDGALEHIEILLLGHRRVGLGAGFPGFDLVPLFRLDAMRIASRPDPENFDNARYLLYHCSGGYPIGSQDVRCSQSPGLGLAFLSPDPSLPSPWLATHPRCPIRVVTDRLAGSRQTSSGGEN
jgi:hypothetical protein